MTTTCKKTGDDDDNVKKTIVIEDIELDTANMLFIMVGAYYFSIDLMGGKTNEK